MSKPPLGPFFMRAVQAEMRAEGEMPGWGRRYCRYEYAFELLVIRKSSSAETSTASLVASPSEHSSAICDDPARGPHQ